MTADVDTNPVKVLAELEKQAPGVRLVHKDLGWLLEGAIRALRVQAAEIQKLREELEGG